MRILRKVNKWMIGFVLVWASLFIYLPILEENLLPVYYDESIQYPFRTNHPSYGPSVCWYWRSSKDSLPPRRFIHAIAEVTNKYGTTFTVPWSWRTGLSFRATNTSIEHEDYIRVSCVAISDAAVYLPTTIQIVVMYHGIIPKTKITYAAKKVEIPISINALDFRPYVNPSIHQRKEL